MGYAIEVMRIDDYDEVVALWRRTEGVGLNEGDGREGIAAYLQRNSELSFIARNKGREIVGAVLCGHDGRRAYMYHLAVATECRGQGIGKALVAACFRRLQELGVEKCSILVYANNERGREFWLRQGWEARDNLRLMQKVTNNKTAS